MIKAAVDTPTVNRAPWRIGQDHFGSYYAGADGVVGEGFGTDGRHFVGNPATPLDQFNIYEVSAQANGYVVRFNGGVAYSSATNTVAFAPAPLLGRAGADFFAGDIAEVIAYDRVLTPTERDTINVYLTVKYAPPAIPLPPIPVLQASALTANSVAVAWSLSSMGYGFTATLERKIGAGAYSALPLLDTKFAYEDTGLSPSTAYTYRVKVSNAAGTSGYSNEAPATTPATGNGIVRSGMRLWLRSDLGLPGSGTFPVWADTSGLGNYARQAVAASRPTVVANQQNGKAVVRFDGTDDGFELPNFMAGATAGEWIVIIKAAQDMPSVDRAPWRIGTDHYGSFYATPDGWVRESFGTNGRYDVGNPSTPLDQYNIYSVSAQAGSYAVRFNGLVAFTSVSNTVAFHLAPLLGRAGASFFAGDIAEVIAYDRVLTAPERDGIYSYLGSKYLLAAIPIPAKPVNLGAVPLSATQVSLAWTQAETNLFKIASIERKTGAGSYQVIAQRNNALGFDDSGLVPATTYIYRVILRSYAGESVYSDPVTVTTLLGSAAMPSAGMRAWLRADIGTEGPGNLGTWEDQSGLGNHAYQTNGVLKPKVVPNQLNGRPVVRFDGIDDYLDLPNMMSAASAGEIIAVLKVVPSAPDTFNNLWSFGGNGGGTAYYNTDIIDYFGTTDAAYHRNPAPTPYHYMNVSTGNGTLTERINNQVTWAQSGLTVAFGSAPSIGRIFKGDIAEIIIYDRVLSPIERQTVLFNLSQRYLVMPPTSLVDYLDLNGDGFIDAAGLALGISPFNLDSDGDGIRNDVEVLNGSDPLTADTDGDGVSDATDAFPLNPARSAPLGPTAGDVTPPVITLTKPANAVLLP